MPVDRISSIRNIQKYLMECNDIMLSKTRFAISHFAFRISHFPFTLSSSSDPKLFPLPYKPAHAFYLRHRAAVSTLNIPRLALPPGDPAEMEREKAWTPVITNIESKGYSEDYHNKKLDTDCD